MAVLGLYQETQNHPQDCSYEVEALHFNIWMLAPSFWSLSTLKTFRKCGAYSYYIDVGLRLTFSSGSISSLDLCLPGVPADNFLDLYDEVLNEKINDLIFGTAVESKNGNIEYDRDGKRVVETVQKIKSFELIDDGPEQRYRVHFSSAIKVDHSDDAYYLRFRYRCQKPNEIVFSKGWGFAKQGYLIDFGVNDVRETINLPERNMSSQMKPIKEFNGFIICPSDFVPVSYSPDFKHKRILEANAWSQYLQSCGKFSLTNKYTIHYWKGKDVTFSNPFRAFMHIHKEFGLKIFLIYILGVATLPLLAAIAKIIGGNG